MFVRVKKVGTYRYLQIAENRREGKRVKQTIIATLGRLDKLTASGAIDQLLRSAARFAERVMVLSQHSRDAHDRPDANVVSIGPALIFERLWRETGCQEVVRKLLATRHHRFDVERAVFMTVLHRLMVSGSDRSALQWRRDQAIDGTEALDLQHLYRAMGWLGEALGEREPDAPSPRRVKDLIEEELFARRRDLFSALDLVFFDTTSLFFTGNGGDTLGQYAKSKDHRSDCKQMVLGMVIDGDGIPVCSEMWPGNTTDVTTLDQVAGRLQSRFGVRRVANTSSATFHTARCAERASTSTAAPSAGPGPSKAMATHTATHSTAVPSPLPVRMMMLIYRRLSVRTTMPWLGRTGVPGRRLPRPRPTASAARLGGIWPDPKESETSRRLPHCIENAPARAVSDP